MSLSLYRTYRPMTFSDVVGQQHVENTLVNALADGNVAHAYLFCGPRGTGKTTTARLLAKALNCEHTAGGDGTLGEPCGTCPQCEAIAAGSHPDVFELDAASNTGVDNVRDEIISRVHFAPTQGRTKVYIIDEVHMLSKGAFNALLKTLEEPPDNVVFVLCTTEANKVLPTIQSRCQRFDFRRLSQDEIVAYLTRICEGEGFSFETGALEMLAEKSAGGMRDATTALEQVAVFSGGKVTEDSVGRLFGQTGDAGLDELAGYIAAYDVGSCLVWLDRVVAAGADLSQVAGEVAAYVRDLFAIAVCGPKEGVVAGGASRLGALADRAAGFATEGGDARSRLERALDVAADLVVELRRSNDQRLSFEVALARLCRPEGEATLEALAERVGALEAGAVAGGAGTVAAGCAGGAGGGSGVAAGSAGGEGGAGGVGGAEPSWPRVAPQKSEWRQQVERQAAEGRPQAGNSDGVPLAEAVRREAEREEAADFARETARGAEAAGEGDPAAGSAEAGASGELGTVAAAAAAETPEAAEAPEAADARAVAGEAPAARGAAEPSESSDAPQTPAPAEAPAPSAQKRGPDMSPARLLAAVLTIVKRDDVPTGALLADVSLVQEGEQYVLVFPEDASFQMRIASSGDAAALIGRAFEETLGHPVRFSCRLGGGAATQPAVAPQSAADSQVAAEGAARPEAAPSAEAPQPVMQPQPAVDPQAEAPQTATDSQGAAAQPSQPAADPQPSQSDTAGVDAGIADALSVFGEGVTVQEVDE